MNPVTINQSTGAIVYDADAMEAPGADDFDPARWRDAGLLTGSAPGRGTTSFINTPSGPAVLRRYLRGGWAARVSSDRYFFTGLQNTRPLAEFHLLRRMSMAGLPVPAPLAALCERKGLFYRGALMTALIDDASTLADLFGVDFSAWELVGATIRKFHQAGVNHADLNARNIMVSHDVQKVWLLDFDRSRFREGRPVDGRSNLRRLRRSFEKLWPGTEIALNSAWQRLENGYHE